MRGILSRTAATRLKHPAVFRCLYDHEWRWPGMAERFRDTDESGDLPDYEIQHADPGLVHSTGATRSVRPWVVAGALLVVAAAAAWFLTHRSPGTTEPPPTEQTATHQQQQQEAPEPLGGAPASVSVPPLDESDSLVRELVRQLTTHPTVAAWLATDGLI